MQNSNNNIPDWDIRQPLTRLKKHLPWLVLLVVVAIGTVITISHGGSAAGIDDVTVTLGDETVSGSGPVTIAFTFSTLTNGNTIKLYLGETTAGNNWGLNAVTTADIACSDNGTGESYTVNSVTAASATVPMWTQITATTVGSGASIVTCVLGDGSPNPTNPSVAGGYSIAVVTTNDSGAGVAYVGNANDVIVTGEVLPNLTLTIDNPDGTACTIASNVVGCNLGVFTVANVNTGNYDLNVGTNATSGASLKIAEDGNFRNGLLEIDDIVEDVGGTVTAGVEEYGVAISSDAAWTESGNFTDDDTPIPTGPATVATTAGPIDKNGNDVTATHRVAISSITEAATYTHIVTWTATANF